MILYIPEIAYNWTADDNQPIGSGFLPYYRTLEELEMNHGNIDYFEIEVNNFPDKSNKPPFENGFSLN